MPPFQSIHLSSITTEARNVIQIIAMRRRLDELKSRSRNVIGLANADKSIRPLTVAINQKYETLNEPAQQAVANYFSHRAGAIWRRWLQQHLKDHPADGVAFRKLAHNDKRAAGWWHAIVPPLFVDGQLMMNK